MRILKPNRLGWVKSLEISMPFGDAIEFSLTGLATGEQSTMLYSELRDWMKNGFAPAYVKEWRCLYCTSPNTIQQAHCTQCGAPRSFILG